MRTYKDLRGNTRVYDSKKMDCGESPLCGVLALESGLGSGHYGGGEPGVHGLWPEVDPYGNSKSVKPKDTTFDWNSNWKTDICPFLNEENNCSQYAGTGPGEDGAFCFPYHEWSKHGQDAGGTGPASVYFETMCELSQPIVDMLMVYKGNWDNMKSAVSQSEWSKYLWNVDEENKQFMFKVCSDGDGIWRFC